MGGGLLPLLCLCPVGFSGAGCESEDPPDGGEEPNNDAYAALILLALGLVGLGLARKRVKGSAPLAATKDEAQAATDLEASRMSTSSFDDREMFENVAAILNGEAVPAQAFTTRYVEDDSGAIKAKSVRRANPIFTQSALFSEEGLEDIGEEMMEGNADDEDLGMMASGGHSLMGTASREMNAGEAVGPGEAQQAGGAGNRAVMGWNDMAVELDMDQAVPAQLGSVDAAAAAHTGSAGSMLSGAQVLSASRGLNLGAGAEEASATPLGVAGLAANGGVPGLSMGGTPVGLAQRVAQRRDSFAEEEMPVDAGGVGTLEALRANRRSIGGRQRSGSYKDVMMAAAGREAGRGAAGSAPVFLAHGQRNASYESVLTQKPARTSLFLSGLGSSLETDESSVRPRTLLLTGMDDGEMETEQEDELHPAFFGRRGLNAGATSSPLAGGEGSNLVLPAGFFGMRAEADFAEHGSAEADGRPSATEAEMVADANQVFVAKAATNRWSTAIEDAHGLDEDEDDADISAMGGGTSDATMFKATTGRAFGIRNSGRAFANKVGRMFRASKKYDLKTTVAARGPRNRTKLSSLLDDSGGGGRVAGGTVVPPGGARREQRDDSVTYLDPEPVEGATRVVPRPLSITRGHSIRRKGPSLRLSTGATVLSPLNEDGGDVVSEETADVGGPPRAGKARWSTAIEEAHGLDDEDEGDEFWDTGGDDTPLPPTPTSDAALFKPSTGRTFGVRTSGRAFANKVGRMFRPSKRYELKTAAAARRSPADMLVADPFVVSSTSEVGGGEVDDTIMPGNETADVGGSGGMMLAQADIEMEADAAQVEADEDYIDPGGGAAAMEADAAPVEADEDYIDPGGAAAMEADAAPVAADEDYIDPGAGGMNWTAADIERDARSMEADASPGEADEDYIDPADAERSDDDYAM